ncbi:MAG: AAA family ATPase, partial [Xenococcus sp. (in: cyanobacteria)]
NCQPYLVQLLCSELVDYLNRKYPQNNLKVKATAQDIENIIPKALEVVSAYFNEFWENSLNEAEREFIRNLINNGSPMEKAPVVVNKLIDKDILKLDDHNQVHFQVPLIERSFTQKIEQES